MAFPVLRNRPPQRTGGSARPAAWEQSPPPRRIHPLLSEEHLLCHAGLAPSGLERLRSLALRWGVSLRRAAIAAGLITPRAEAEAIADICGFRSMPRGVIPDLRRMAETPEPYRALGSRAPMPLAASSHDAVLNAGAYTPEQLSDLSYMLGPERDRVAVADGDTLRKALAIAFGPALAEDAANGLSRQRPRLSAAHGICRWQALFLILAAGLFAGSVIFAPREAVAIYGALLSLMFFMTITLRVAAAGHAAYRHWHGVKRHERRPREFELPVYTVLVAMYREARVLPDLVDGLKALNYPALGSKRTKDFIAKTAV
jgi:uncharacterized membrane protein